MGCFNVSCGLSHCSISEGDKAGLLLLRPNAYADLKSPVTHVISNDGAFTLFRAQAFPIWGKYNSYGMLEKIEKTKNTKALEKYFGVKIGEIVQQVARPDDNEAKLDGMDEDKKKQLKSLYGTFISKGIYDEMARCHLEKCEGNAFKGARLTPEWLWELGFSFLKELDEKDKERYNQIFVHDSSDKYVVMSDGEFSHIGEKTSKRYVEAKTDFIHNLETLTKEWKKLTKHSFDLEKFKTTSMFKYSLSKCRNMMIVAQTCDKETKKNILFALEDRFYGKLFWEIYGEHFKEELDWVDNLNQEFRHVYWMMYCTNRMFMPVMSGPQDGEPKIELELCNLISESIKKEIKSRN